MSENKGWAIKEYVLKRGMKRIEVPDGSFVLDKVVRGDRVFLSLLIREEMPTSRPIEVLMLPKGNIDKYFNGEHMPIGSVSVGKDVFYVFYKILPELGLKDLNENEPDDDE